MVVFLTEKQICQKREKNWNRNETETCTMRKGKKKEWKAAAERSSKTKKRQKKRVDEKGMSLLEKEKDLYYWLMTGEPSNQWRYNFSKYHPTGVKAILQHVALIGGEGEGETDGGGGGEDENEGDETSILEKLKRWRCLIVDLKTGISATQMGEFTDRSAAVRSAAKGFVQRLSSPKPRPFA